MSNVIPLRRPALACVAGDAPLTLATLHALGHDGASLARATTHGGLVLAVGTWLYQCVPGGLPTCGVVVAIEGDTGPACYSVIGGMRALPRTRVMVRWDGGVADARPVEHVDDAVLTRYRPHNGLTGYVGFLEAVYPNEDARAAFVARCQDEPRRRAEEAARIEAEKERERTEVGPWFRDLEDAIAGGRSYVPDTVEAKVIRRALKELVGVTARVTVRRYSMASGLDFKPAKGREDWSDEEAARIASVFPKLAWPSRIYDRETGESRDGWRVDTCAHPSKREDRSDGMADYHDPGGFRVANAYLLDVSHILSEEVAK